MKIYKVLICNYGDDNHQWTKLVLSNEPLTINSSSLHNGFISMDKDHGDYISSVDEFKPSEILINAWGYDEYTEGQEIVSKINNLLN